MCSTNSNSRIRISIRVLKQTTFTIGDDYVYGGADIAIILSRVVCVCARVWVCTPDRNDLKLGTVEVLYIVSQLTDSAFKRGIGSNSLCIFGLSPSHDEEQFTVANIYRRRRRNTAARICISEADRLL